MWNCTLRRVDFDLLSLRFHGKHTPTELPDPAVMVGFGSKAHHPGDSGDSTEKPLNSPQTLVSSGDLSQSLDHCIVIDFWLKSTLDPDYYNDSKWPGGPTRCLPPKG